MAILSTLFTALLAASSTLVSAHGDESDAALHRRNVHAIKARDALSRCSAKLKAREFVEHRMAKRDQLVSDFLVYRRMEKRTWIPKPQMMPPANNSEACILAPEVTVGPYYLPDELIRKDIRAGEGVKGVPLLLDLQFVDVNTCKPVRNAMIDVWHANSTGVYSGFEAEGTAEMTYLRGLQPTDRNGIMHMISSVPGWYSGRATHIHIAAHINGQVNRANRTYSGGNVTHIGQVFFPEPFLEQIDVTAPYSTNKVSAARRIRNVNDGIYNQEATGNDAVAEVQMVNGKDLTHGVMAYLTIGIDLNANYDMTMGGGPGGPGGPPGGPSGFPGGPPPSGVSSGLIPSSTAA